MANGLQTQPDLNEGVVVNLLEFLFGKQKALETSRQSTDTARRKAVEKYSEPVKSDKAIDVTSPAMQQLIRTLTGSYEQAALKNQVDIDAVLRQKLSGKNPFMHLFQDVLVGMMGPQVKTVREKLFEQEVLKRQLRTQQMDVMARTLQSLGIADAQRLTQRTAGRKQAADIEGQGLKAQDAVNLAEKKNIDTQEGKVIQGLTDVEVTRQEEEIKQKGRLELAQKRADIFKTQPVPKTLVRDLPSDDFVGPWGTMVQDHSYNAVSGSFEPIPGRGLRYKLTPKQQENRQFSNDSYKATLKITKQAAELKAKDPASGAIARVALRNALVPLLAAVRVAGFELPGFLEKYELGAREGTFLNTFYESVLSKVRAFTGAQVTNQERTYILVNTIPRLWAEDRTFLLGFEALRLYTGLDKARINDLHPNSQGLTSLTEVELDSEGMPVGAATFKDLTSVYEGILAKAEALELKEAGAGMAFLQEMAPDATKPLQIEKNWKDYVDPSIEAYRRAREQ